MSNINKFMKGGGRKKPDAPADEAARPKPGAVPPLVDASASARTKQVDLSAAARADAEQASEDERTTEVAGKGAAAPLYPAAPPRPVPPASAPAGKVVPIKPVARAVAPAAPVEAEPASGAEAEPSAAPSPAKPAGEKSIDAGALLERIKTTVQGLLAPLEERLGKLEEAIAGNDEMVNSVIEAVAGPNPNDPDAKKVDDDGKPIVGLSDQVAALSEALAKLKAQLLGPNPDETLEEFGGEPVVPMLTEQVMETATFVNEVVGKDGERIPSIVNNNTKMTAKTLVLEMLKPEPDEAKLRQAAIEGGPDTSKDILAALAASEEYAVEVVGALYLAPAESLDDADKAQLKADVYNYAKAVGQRAQYYHDNLDWTAIDAAAAAYRAPEPAPEAAPEQTGGDS